MWTQFQLAASIVGVVTLSFWALKLVRTAYATFLRPSHDLYKRYKGEGEPWALVTGGSDGIGKAYAMELAKRGFNILNVSRTPAKLEAVKAEILATYPSIQVESVTLDMALASFDEIYDVVTQAMAGRDVAVVINNAGLAPHPQRLAAYEAVETLQARNAIAVNVVAFTAVLSAALPILSARKSRGGVVNVSSSSAYQGFAYNAVYASTKAYNHVMSQTLAAEERGKLDVISHTPLFVASNMTRLKANMFVATAEQTVVACLDSLGHDDITSGVLSHKVQNAIIAALPRNIFQQQTIKAMKATRRKVEKKLAAAKKE
ncbi:uncharacterized protein MONBRDRAFT_34247 [Monosiga brevicollis MX1]|uniref:Uncharacterized protein n=1 Tax=Monosiga brevicollis TaxID=81824 RepID=A9VAH1_MONBE|nr:uncharacterized protein MONBRDRAFT_34247 [Monosiga brevicollis MX1]EDQ85485.1 predicted protein [Monosiga brevicollis MX1]|eukprot:XP_001749676.1 hypothetical protein [Monosiga brevicollis MX1]